MDNSIYYQPIFLAIIGILTVIYSSFCKKYSYGNNVVGYQDPKLMTVLLFIFCLVIGFRPVGGIAFGDTGTYTRFFYSYIGSIPPIIGEEEWAFNYLMYLFANTIGDVSIFYTFVCFVYVFSMYYFCKKLIPSKLPLAMMFCVSAFSFFSYGTNGIRNGMACSMVLTAIAVASDKKIRGYIIASIIAFFAYHIHHSSALPIICFIAANIYNNPRRVLAFWIVSIFISLVAGNSVSNFFASLGFDDRVSHYLNVVEYDGQFSRTGFRWDFLLYSSMPILLGYIILIKKGKANGIYQILLSTYVLANSFWVMVIRAPFSNRFAYLSWFLYPIVIAYPLLTMNVWEAKQGAIVSRVLLAHTGFTLFMFFLYH